MPDLQRVRQQYQEQMPRAHTPATLGVRPVMAAPVSLHTHPLRPHPSRGDVGPSSRGGVYRIDLDLESLATDPEHARDTQRLALGAPAAAAAPSLLDLLHRESFMSELLEGFSAGSLSGFQVPHSLSHSLLLRLRLRLHCTPLVFVELMSHCCCYCCYCLCRPAIFRHSAFPAPAAGAARGVALGACGRRCLCAVGRALLRAASVSTW